jgi:hypothetical protein
VESKGSRRQNAGPTNRKRIEASASDEKAYIFKVRNLYGRRSRRCDGHKREGRCALPGEVCRDADVSRGRLRIPRPYPRAEREGGIVALNFDDEGDAE